MDTCLSAISLWKQRTELNAFPVHHSMLHSSHFTSLHLNISPAAAILIYYCTISCVLSNPISNPIPIELLFSYFIPVWIIFMGLLQCFFHILSLSAPSVFVVWKRAKGHSAVYLLFVLAYYHTKCSIIILYIHSGME